MGRYLIKRLLWVVPILLGITFVIHVSMSLVPGDPARIILGESASPEQIQSLRAEWGLDRPFLVRYVTYVGKVVRGDFGRSYRTQRPVVVELKETAGPTVKLGLAALLITVLLGVPVGVMAAVKRNSWIDHLTGVLSLLGLSMPLFWTGLLLIYAFAYKWPLLPIGGATDGLASYVLPAVTLALNSVAMVSRVTRSSLLDVLKEDYIRTARAKGLRERTVIFLHALRPAFVPIMTVIGLQLGLLLGGSVLTETVFSWPGIGRLMVTAIGSRDLLVIQGGSLLLSVGFVFVNLATDLSYALFDPRIRFA